MGQRNAENLKLGIFVVVGTVLLVIAAYLIGNRQNMFTRNITISALFTNANGLQNGNNVRFSGINVGTVSRIEMHNDTTIEVYMVVEEKMRGHIRKSAIATIGSDGLVGSMLVNIVPGDQNAAWIEEGDQLRSYTKIAPQDMLNTLSATNENAAILMADLLEISQALTQGEGTLGRLLNDKTLADELEETVSNLHQLSVRANTAVSGITEIIDAVDFEESAAGVLLGDSLAAGSMRNILQNLETSSSEMNQITTRLNTLVTDLNDSESLVNFIATDSSLVRQLEQTLTNIEQGTQKFDENMEALKHNFLTRGYFRKLEKEKKKASRESNKVN